LTRPLGALEVATTFGHHVVVGPLVVARIERRSEEEMRRAGSIVLSMGGIVGPVVAAIVEKVGTPEGPAPLYLRHRETPPLAEMTEVTTLWAADVPVEVTSLAGWPAVESHRAVTLYPKRAIASAAVSYPGGLVLRLRREANAEVALRVTPWQVARLRRALEHWGYPVEAADLTPSAS
jgi:hypothetical protein